jgi:hypothetical protein
MYGKILFEYSPKRLYSVSVFSVHVKLLLAFSETTSIHFQFFSSSAYLYRKTGQKKIVNKKEKKTVDPHAVSRTL